MILTSVNSIPNGCLMLERAYHYVDTNGKHYYVNVKSPQGNDTVTLACAAGSDFDLGAIGPSGGFSTGA